MNQLFYTLITMICISSCVTRLPTPQGIKDISTSEYENIIESKTKKTEVYDGFYNKLTIQATKLDAEMSENLIAYSAKLSQWNLEKYKEEKNKLIDNHSTQTEFFMSFYTPERKHDDLSSKQTTWKIYLDVNGQRYEGKAAKVKSLFLDLEAIYPHHNRWSTPYVVSFPISTAATETQKMTITVTGPLATTQINF